jgi:hypothetical protein
VPNRTAPSKLGGKRNHRHANVRGHFWKPITLLQNQLSMPVHTFWRGLCSCGNRAQWPKHHDRTNRSLVRNNDARSLDRREPKKLLKKDLNAILRT